MYVFWSKTEYPDWIWELVWGKKRNFDMSKQFCLIILNWSIFGFLSQWLGNWPVIFFSFIRWTWTQASYTSQKQPEAFWDELFSDSSDETLLLSRSFLTIQKRTKERFSSPSHSVYVKRKNEKGEKNPPKTLLFWVNWSEFVSLIFQVSSQIENQLLTHL